MPGFHRDWMVGIGDCDAYGIMFYASYYRIAMYHHPRAVMVQGTVPIVHTVFQARVAFGDQARLTYTASGQRTLVTWRINQVCHCTLCLDLPPTEDMLPTLRKLPTVVPLHMRQPALSTLQEYQAAYPHHSTTACPASPCTVLDALYWFERSRSDSIGGPAQLLRLQKRGTFVNACAMSEVSVTPHQTGAAAVYAFIHTIQIGEYVVFHTIVSEHQQEIVARAAVHMIVYDESTKAKCSPFPSCAAH